MSGNSMNSSPRRYSLRAARGPTRRKSTIVVDLNSPPPPAPPPPSALNSLAAAAAAAEAAEVDTASSSDPAAGGAAAPIDVEAIDDDEIKCLSSSSGFPQARNHPRRKNRVILVIDEEQESHPRQPVMATHPNHSNKRLRIPPNRTIINCESYSSSEGKKAVPEPKKVEVPKEPTFGCPICMDKLTNPCSTVCGHIFCESCLNDAVRSQKKCPTCRTKMTNKSFHRIFLPNATAD